MDAPIPGVGLWDELAHAPQAWHFYFYGPDEERPVAGRERIYLDRFYDELSANPANDGVGSYGQTMATAARAAFSSVTAETIPDAGHWLMEEQPQAVVRAVRAFLNKPLPSRGG